jgi:hypothetical protein
MRPEVTQLNLEAKPKTSSSLFSAAFTPRPGKRSDSSSQSHSAR